MSEASSHKQRLKEMTEDLEMVTEKIPMFKGMIYGPQGAGKTVFAIGLAQQLLKGTGKTIVHVDTSEGWVSLRNHPVLANNVKTVRYRGYEYLETLIYAIKNKVAPFDNVGAMVWDEMNKMVDRDTEFVFKARDNNQSGVPEWPDYYKALQRVRDLSHFLYRTNPDIHLIMTSHEKDKKNDKGLVILTYPSISPRINEELGGDLHVIGRLKTKTIRGSDGMPEYTRELQVHPTARIVAKTRVGGLPVLVDPGVFIRRTIEWLQVASPVSSEPEAPIGEIADVDLTNLIETSIDPDDEPVFTNTDA